MLLERSTVEIRLVDLMHRIACFESIVVKTQYAYVQCCIKPEKDNAASASRGNTKNVL